MLIFNCTKAAANFLSPHKSKESKPLIQAVPDFDIEDVGSPQAPISQWLVQHTKQLGQDILYVCHVQHRFTMVFTGVEKGNWLQFMQCFWERLVNHFCWLIEELSLNINSSPQNWVDNIRTLHSQNGERPIFCLRYSPSVNASAARFRSTFETALYEIGCLPNDEEAGEFEFHENSRIHFSGCKENMFYPAHELLCNGLEMYMDVSGNDLDAFKSLSFNYFEQTLSDMFNVSTITPEDVAMVLNTLTTEKGTNNR
ncbi:hypothetical protein HAS15_24435 [Vibrio campbellii]|uniref:Uncharacterized protein n=1 Tax=Vibrio campbellii (strain ATCC BAA-1116) TaxID=2902295 RepID=A7N8T4_VIBC1|nr:hypothetical protein [Vibrio campbellii]ABU75087.1 hypothetical protein VIBHAR_p08240 [Vibrio campbellii ATCC BAA-1116]AGU99090.1 hypothetical protein M892_28615 [Vibrio campbellii ATCC BAA-1116]MBT0124662.1 hypothetical protein [Vibrio campbellii]MBT0139457.1 hypothetical protein [Vibrio campbellii]MBT0144259.1 hypothetical protein [Vibrio campbellii]